MNLSDEYTFAPSQRYSRDERYLKLIKHFDKLKCLLLLQNMVYSTFKSQYT